MISIAPSTLAGTSRTLAALLAKEYGECSFMHYGLIDSSREEGAECSLLQMQRCFAEKLAGIISEALAPDGQVLLGGLSLTFLAQQLRTQGLEVEHCSMALLPGSFESQFDLVLIEGSYHFLDQLPLLSRARELLSDKGHLVLFGEFLDDDSKIERSQFPNLSSLRQLAERLSFSKIRELNFSYDAMQSLVQMQSIVEKHGEINSELKAEEISQLSQELDKAYLEFDTQRRCFKVFEFAKDNEVSGEYALAEYSAIDSFEPGEIVSLFERSFNTEFNLDVWQWKYALGDGKCVVARSSKGGEIVSHYGGAPRQIQYFGESNTAIQVCDVMVLPEIRRQYGKSSLFFKTAATFLEREIGNTVNHLLGFGFPNQKAMNIALRLGLYEKTDDYIEFLIPQVGAGEHSNLELIPIEINKPQHQAYIDSLWDEMKEGFVNGIVGDRHWQYIKYRYFDHPFGISNLYRSVFLSEYNESPLAAIFLKEHDQRLLIMDIVCAPQKMRRVIEELNKLLSESELKIWVTKGHSNYLRIESVVENNLGIEIPSNYWNPGPSAKTLYGAWWLTAGDMDFL